MCVCMYALCSEIVCVGCDLHARHACMYVCVYALCSEIVCVGCDLHVRHVCMYVCMHVCIHVNVEQQCVVQEYVQRNSTCRM